MLLPGRVEFTIKKLVNLYGPRMTAFMTCMHTGNVIKAKNNFFEFKNTKPTELPILLCISTMRILFFHENNNQ